MELLNNHHHFDINIAEICGVNAAVIFTNFRYWIDKNMANNKHYHDGFYWTYNSKDALSKLFPYLTPRQVDFAIQKLYENGLLIKGNYNNNGYDKTNWYTIPQNWSTILQNCLRIKQKCSSIKQKCSDRTNNIVESYTDINTNINSDINNSLFPSTEENLSKPKKAKVEKVLTNKEMVCKEAHKILIDYFCLEYKPTYVFSGGKDASAMKGIISKIYDVQNKISEPTVEVILSIFKLICAWLPLQNEYYKTADLSVINSKFNSIIESIKIKHYEASPFESNESRFDKFC